MSTARKERADEEIYIPTPEEEAMLEESLAEIERGQTFDWDGRASARLPRAHMQPGEAG